MVRSRLIAQRGSFLLMLLLLGASVGAQTPAVPAEGAVGNSDVVAARALFEKNLQAIRDKNKDAYLACYLNSPGLARTGATGFELGYSGLAATAGQGWPDHFEAEDLRLTPIQPGVVYATYRYRVRYGAREEAGLSERVFLKTPAGWRIAVSTAFAGEPGVPPSPRALVGATLLDGKGGTPVPDATVLLRDGKIECAGSRAACPVPAGIGVVDLRGQWVTPGLVDSHVHFSQTGWADGRPDSQDVRATHPYEKVEADLKAHPERFGHTYLCSGVTAVFDVGGYPWTLELAKRFGESTEVPHVAAAGPLLSTLDHWLNLPAERQFIYLKDEAVGRSGVDYLASQGSRAVKVWFIPEEKGPSIAEMGKAVRAAGEEARKVGLPLIVHATGLDEAKEALRAGAKLLVHSVWDQPIDDDFIHLLKKNGAIYCPTLTVLRGYLAMSEGAVKKTPPPVDDPNGCVDPGTLAKVAESAKLPPQDTAERIATRHQRIAALEKLMGMNLKRVLEAGVTIAMGTDAGNPLTLHGPSVYAEMEAMQAAGLTPLQVLTASTRGGALAMRLDPSIGTVEKGKAADLLIVGGDPAADVANLRKVRYVVRGGVLRSLAELKALATVGEK
jgi:imidazolonepropionase-like amidohydrolase